MAIALCRHPGNRGASASRSGSDGSSTGSNNVPQDTTAASSCISHTNGRGVCVEAFATTNSASSRQWEVSP